MEKLDRKNRGPNGTKPLIHYMNPEDKRPTALAVELFFRHNILVIKSVYPDILEREELREELKDHFESLLHRPIGNNLHSCFRKWRAVSPDCQFGYLIQVIKKVYETYVRNNFNAHTMKEWKQKEGELVQDYNIRYYQRLAELYPDFENTLYRMKGDGTDQNNYWRMEIVGIYIASLRPELRSRMPVFKNNEKCLENAMVTAEAYEKELSERKGRLTIEEQRESKNEKRAYSVETRNNKNEAECHNCGRRGHLRRECRKPPVECQHCKRTGHLIQYCYGKRAKPGGNTNAGISKKLAALVITSILMMLSEGVQQAELEEYHYQTGTTLVTDIFKVTNHRVTCEITRYIPMVGDERTFYPTKGEELITFKADKTDYGICLCTIRNTPTHGFLNANTGDCYVPNNTTVIFEEEIPKWEQYEMELFANNRETSGLYWMAWNDYVLKRRKANYLPAKLGSEPFEILEGFIENPPAPKTIKSYKDRHLEQYEKMKRLVRSGSEEAAIKAKYESREVMNDVDNAVEQIEIPEDKDPAGDNLDLTIIADRKNQEAKDSEESIASSLDSERLNALESSLGITNKNKGRPKNTPSLIPPVRTIVERVPNTRNSRPRLISGDSSSSEILTRSRTSILKGSKSEELTKSLSTIIEKSRENDIPGVIKELMNSFQIVDGMEAIGVFIVCVSVILGAYYKRRIVNQMISSVWEKLRRRRTSTTTPRREVHISRSIINRKSDDEESIELITSNIKESGKDRGRKGSLDLCDPERLKFTESEAKLSEAARKEGYILMLQTISKDKSKHTPTIIMNIENRQVQVYIDDGSDISLISEDEWISLGKPTIKRTSTWIGNTNEKIITKGTVRLRIKMCGKRVFEKFYVVQGLAMKLLIGRTFLARFTRYIHHYQLGTITIGNYTFHKTTDNREKLVLMTTKNTTILPGTGQDFY